MSGCLESERYLESCQTEFWQGVFRAEIDHLTRHLEGSEDILSVGCGPAIIESGLSERGFRVTGLDVSRETLNCAPDHIRTVAARAEDMPFPESSFDAVIYIASLQFIENYRKAIEQTVACCARTARSSQCCSTPGRFFQRPNPQHRLLCAR